MTLKINQSSDSELIHSYRVNGQTAAVGELFIRHSLMCFAVCNLYLKNTDEAQDATMSIFENLFKDLKKHDIGNFRNWLHSVCRNYCLMKLRNPEMKQSKNKISLNEETFGMELGKLLHQQDNALEKENKLVALEEALLQLKSKQKRCVELFYLEQKSYEEISKITGYNINDVKSNLQNGKRNLKIILGNLYFTLLITLLWTSTTA